VTLAFGRYRKLVGDSDKPLSKEKRKIIYVANLLRNDEILKAR
jgi:hypothetical protein